MNLTERMSAAAADIGSVGKNQTNMHQKFRFRGIDDVLNAVGPVFAKHGLTVRPLSIDMLANEERTGGRIPQTHLVALVTYRWQAGDEYLDSQVLAEALDTSDKAAFKLMSMAYKYAVIQTLSLPVEGLEDGDKDSIQRAPRSSNGAAPSREQLDGILERCAERAGITVEEITAKWRAEHGGLTPDEFAALPADDIRGLVQTIQAYVTK